MRICKNLVYCILGPINYFKECIQYFKTKFLFALVAKRYDDAACDNIVLCGYMDKGPQSACSN